MTTNGEAAARHTLIVEGSEDKMTLVPIFAENTEEVFLIGHELFPGVIDA